MIMVFYQLMDLLNYVHFMVVYSFFSFKLSTKLTGYEHCDLLMMVNDC